MSQASISSYWWYLLWAGLWLGLGGSTLLSLSVGTLPLMPGELIWLALGEGRPEDLLVFWQIRLPRTLSALLVGASLGVSGAAMQGFLRNPLADPGLLGISSGAALFASAWIAFGPWLPLGSYWVWGTAPAAFSGASLAMGLVMGLAYRRAGTSLPTLILAGVAVNALAGALTTLVIYLAQPNQLRAVLFWAMGHLGGNSWAELAILALTTLIGLLAILPQAKKLDLLALGAEEAQALGVRTGRLQWQMILATTLMTGSSVALCGAIGFVGLAVPHIVRLAIGALHLRVLPGSALLGGWLLLMADLLARGITAPGELPVGAVTALFGGPFFLFLLFRLKMQQ